MKKYSTIKIVAIFFLVILAMGCKKNAEKTSRVDALPYYKDASFTPEWFTADDQALANFHKIPGFKLLSQNGAIISDKTFEDKIYVTDFFFTTCPGICPKMTSNMAVLQEAFKADDTVLLLSHSVTPEIDSVAVLKKYAEEKGVDASKWYLATGDRSEIYSLGRESYFVEEDLGEIKTEDDFLHTENFVLIDKNKHIRGIYNGLNKAAIQQLITDIKTLQKEG
ncbi:SCO family protein [Cellulophaga sp. F20128]|uniref:SCO family protein n=1 Tax=Cellulophaga sp. F20128 TaxID=2926413 RepID=UPI001FF577CA|nr:SCO family protein [Cellulophaga sp. F20128]MCK0156780.1 SCO family protein [Cellulophaga sp. F20128]